MREAILRPTHGEEQASQAAVVRAAPDKTAAGGAVAAAEAAEAAKTASGNADAMPAADKWVE